MILMHKILLWFLYIPTFVKGIQQGTGEGEDTAVGQDGRQGDSS